MYDFWNIVRLKIKEQGKGLFVPFMINLICIPMLIWNTYQRYGLEDETRMQIIKFTQYFTPVLILIWVLFSFVKYVDQEGNDIYFLTGRMKWKEVLGSYALYLISNTWVFVIYAKMFDHMLLEWIRIAIETFLFVAMAYCLVFITKSIAATLVVILVYAFESVFVRDSSFATFQYYSWQPANIQEISSKYMILMIIAIIFFAVGIYSNKKMHTYK